MRWYDRLWVEWIWNSRFPSLCTLCVPQVPSNGNLFLFPDWILNCKSKKKIIFFIDIIFICDIPTSQVSYAMKPLFISNFFQKVDKDGSLEFIQREWLKSTTSSITRQVVEPPPKCNVGPPRNDENFTTHLLPP
jgi:hypothetical protein